MTWEGAWPSHQLSESRRRLYDLRNELDHLGDDVSSEIAQALSRFLVIRAFAPMLSPDPAQRSAVMSDPASFVEVTLVRRDWSRRSKSSISRSALT
jgi:hypothetical protein